MAYYTWSSIKNGKEEVKVGTEVTASSLNLSKVEFGQLIESGVVRTMPYPPIDTRNPNAVSPVDFYAKQRKAAIEGSELDSVDLGYGLTEDDEEEEEELS